MNNFLRTRDEINQLTKYLQDNNLIESGLSCKNYDIANVVPYLKGNMDVLDMGSDGSEILSNAVKLGITGRKVGIDLAYPVSMVTNEGVEIIRGDLMQTELDDNSFDLISCLSVVEHSVDLDKLAKEVSRLLRIGGTAFISFDYFDPKPNTENMKLYSLDWEILDRQNVEFLVKAFLDNGLELTSDIDWTIQDAVINPTYCSPAQVSYTFGILQFVKKM